MLQVLCDSAKKIKKFQELEDCHQKRTFVTNFKIDTLYSCHIEK